MMSMGFLLRLQLLLSLFAFLGALQAAGAPPSAAGWLERLPAWFEPNQGFVSPDARYVSRGAGYLLRLGDSGAELSLTDGSQAAKLRMELAGASRKPLVEALDPQRARTNYLLGNQRNRWKTDVPHYGRVRYRGAYPG